MGFPIVRARKSLQSCSEHKEEVSGDYSGVAKELLPCDLIGDFVYHDSSILDYSFTTNTKVVPGLLCLVVEDITLKPNSVKLIF